VGVGGWGCSLPGEGSERFERMRTPTIRQAWQTLNLMLHRPACPGPWPTHLLPWVTRHCQALPSQGGLINLERLALANELRARVRAVPGFFRQAGVRLRLRVCCSHACVHGAPLHPSCAVAGRHQGLGLRSGIHRESAGPACLPVFRAPAAACAQRPWCAVQPHAGAAAAPPAAACAAAHAHALLPLRAPPCYRPG